MTDNFINSRIKSVRYFQPHRGSSITLCEITIDNGFSVIGQSDHNNFCLYLYSSMVGEESAYKKAYDQLWALFAFLFAENQMKAAMPPANEDPTVRKKRILARGHSISDIERNTDPDSFMDSQGIVHELSPSLENDNKAAVDLETIKQSMGKKSIRS